MKLVPFIILVTLSSCATPNQPAHKEGKANYTLTDVSGEFNFQRETKIINKRLVSRTIMLDVKSRKTVEKSITVSQIGTIKSKKARILTVRPLASEFTVWLEGKKYSSLMRLEPMSRSMTVKVESPDANINGTSEIPFPKGQYFCFYSQIPDCLYHNQFLQRSFKNSKQKYDFFVVWDSYPFIQEQFNGLSKTLFARARLKFDGEVKKNLRYMVELEGQDIVYHFSKSFELVKIAWIAQGLTVVPPGEEISNEDE